MSDERIYTEEKLQAALSALHARIAGIEDERRESSVLRSYRIAGVLQGLAIACLIYAAVKLVRGSNS